MTIDEAIETLTEIAEVSLLRFDNRDKKAILLGKEALKRCQTLAQNSPLWATKPLPGETKD